jgi:hypothetical protein
LSEIVVFISAFLQYNGKGAVGFIWARGVVAAVAVVQEIVAEAMILPT